MCAEGLAFTVNPVDAVTHTDAGTDLILLTPHDLGNDVGISNVGTGHADQIE